MSKDDFDHLTIRRTRTGRAQGDATERQMLDAINDTGSFRTRIRRNADGSETRMKTKGGMPEFVTDDPETSQAPTCSIVMDSGIVDLISATPTGESEYDNSSGVLYRTQYVQQVVSAGSSGSIGPVIGKIKPPLTSGTAPEDALPASSFLSDYVHGSAYSKKRLAAIVPPSMFTGKLRLYIQALYGRHDHADFLAYQQNAAGQPCLLMDWTERFGEESVEIDTSCGIHTDLSTGEHTLIKVQQSRALFYPLTPSACAKKLRAKLIDTGISVGDRERIEAYILSQSTISASAVFEKDLDLSVHPYSMGYGWHFNWGGSACDIVHNSVVHYSGINYENESTHFRITFSKNIDGSFSALSEVIEGPVRWKSLRNVEPIASPNWKFNALEKFGSGTSGPLQYGDAPFYVFYARNEINICRYNAYSQSYYKSGITREPDYFWLGQYMSVGADAVNWRTREEWSGTTTTISCGQYQVSYQQGSYVDNVYVRESPDPMDVVSRTYVGQNTSYTNGVIQTPVGQPSYISTSTVVDEYFGNILRYDGGGGTTGLSGWELQEDEFYDVRLNWGLLYVRAASESFVQNVSKETTFLTVIPFYDAEAIYIRGSQTITSVDTGTGKTEHGAWYSWNGIVETDSIFSITGIASDGAYNFSLPENLHDINRTDVQTNTTSKLICGSNAIDASFPSIASFFTTEDFIDQRYPTRSSASGYAVTANENSVDYGNSQLTTISLSVYVGWA